MRYRLPINRKRSKRQMRFVETVGRFGIDKELGGTIFRIYTKRGHLASLDVFATQQQAADRAADMQGIRQGELK